MTHPKRADAFKEWSRMMLEQATVPDRLQFKSTGSKSKSVNGGMTSRRKRRKRFRRKRRKQD